MFLDVESAVCERGGNGVTWCSTCLLKFCVFCCYLSSQM
jgi:hypothetical protein